MSGFEPEEARSLRAAESCELGSVDTGMSRSLENCRGREPLGVRFPPLPLVAETTALRTIATGDRARLLVPWLSG
jgi:hypothetical protein